ncbi:Bcr/CflA family drug resistance efflux transporter [Alkalilimnicola ehrlichii]|uniref:Bcr/CflA family efflux transporter n=1 Tax=Alkalilimnicola ehrlichii TaxID=351052 RepID=A0A3E0WS46_9GAMM|nr:Bcr/CflA family multidrug efflux MFS transporter [Alkalilimnicola ehrlichii]RFA28208.1 Bcr/CflA family drug resistance efflux transporter [Alkalilimnicola ehrlichii]RFA34805.1 Bcr/CflA family drug resistance efflux transporter [Alkalilimnicola ehrlichii]
MRKPNTLSTTLLLTSVVALGPLAVDMYLPALPAIGEALTATPDEVQLTLSLYMAGFAIAQLFVGPLSDRFGRKPILVGGLMLFAVASLLCITATTVEALWLGRFLQAFGGSAGPVLGRAAVRDLYPPRDAARTMSYMGSVTALAPAVAPLLGGALLLFYGWQSSFVAVAIYAVGVMCLLALKLPETLPLERRQSIRPSNILRNFAVLARHRQFVGYTLTNSMSFGGMFAFISGSSFVLIGTLGVAEQAYGLYFAVTVLGMVAGAFFGGRFSRRLGMSRLTLLGAFLVAGGGSSMGALALLDVHTVAAVIGPHTVYMAGAGIMIGQTMAGATAPFPHMAGSASSLFGFIQMTLAALIGAAVGQFHDGTPTPMAIIIATTGALSLASYWFIVRRPGPRAVRI